MCHARYRRGSCTRSVIVFFLTPSSTAVGAVSGGTGLPARHVAEPLLDQLARGGDVDVAGDHEAGVVGT